MSKYKTRIVESKSHGKCVSFFIRTFFKEPIDPVLPVDPIDPVLPDINCTANYVTNQLDEHDDSLAETYHFTYSRNDGPIKHVMVTPVHHVPDIETHGYDDVLEEPDWLDELLEILNTLDNDLCRSQDGEGIAFYINVDQDAFPHQLLPKFDCKPLLQYVDPV